VVDSSFGILRSFSNTLPIPMGNKPTSGTETEYTTKPGFNLLRRESGFSIASLAASLPMGGRPRSTSVEETGQQLITVSRPSSLRSKTFWRRNTSRGDGDDNDNESQDDDDESDDESESVASGDEESDEAAEETASVAASGGDARSIRSFESMLVAGKGQGKNKKNVRPRKSISDRLASVSAVAAASKVRVWFLKLFLFCMGKKLTFGRDRHLLLVHQDLLCSFRALKQPIYEFHRRPILHHHHHRCRYVWHHQRSGLLNVLQMIFVFRK
jgi:hypothetical protein